MWSSRSSKCCLDLRRHGLLRYTNLRICAIARRSGFTREEAGPAGQSPSAVHRCRRYRIRG
ncbi:hypothetical protein GEV41_08065 [Pseudomonas putida]|nr:hypothetical protein GEV41_08065 [Pseudomonas putida]